MITPEIITEFKERMRLGDGEDRNIERILISSLSDLTRICGSYDIEKDFVFKELVFERSRYVYNDALEYFYDNFLTQINNLNISKSLESISVEDDSDAAI